MSRMKTVALTLVLAAGGAGAAGGKKSKGDPVPDLPSLDVPAAGKKGKTEPDLPTSLEPALPELPDALTEGGKSVPKVIEARPVLAEPAASAPALVPAASTSAPTPPPTAFFLALSGALAVPGADLDLAPAYALELGWAPSPGGVAFGLRAAYALLAAKREVMVQGRGLDLAAWQASHLVPVALFVRAPLGGLGEGLTPFVEAAGGLGIAATEIHAFGSTDAALSASPEVAATLGIEWRPADLVGLSFFGRLRSTSAHADGRAAQAFLRPALSSAETGGAVSLHF